MVEGTWGRRASSFDSRSNGNATEDDLHELCQRYDDFYRFANLLEMIVQDIHDGKNISFMGLELPNNKIISIQGLSNDEKEHVIVGLRVLKRDRGNAWNRDCDTAEREGKRPPGPKNTV